MKRTLWMLALALVVGLAVVACSGGGTSTPVAPAVDESASLTNVTGARNNYYPVLICHANPDGDDGDPVWVVLEKDDSQVSRHCANHGDFTTGGTFGCSDCDLSGYAVGDDCSACAGAF